MFVTKIQTYFKAKDATVPVRLELRPVVNGAPSSDDIIPAVVVLPPSAVQTAVSQTQASALSSPTTFTFDEPIFLEYDEEYAIVLLSDCNSYAHMLEKLMHSNLVLLRKELTDNQV